eukprot:scaffold13836_cov74-Phaeocystis_antarctica.AAC.3
MSPESVTRFSKGVPRSDSGRRQCMARVPSTMDSTMVAAQRKPKNQDCLVWHGFFFSRGEYSSTKRGNFVKSTT